MMFQGSDYVARNQHGLLVDSAGGRWNATTSKDRTNYYETLSSNYLDLGLWLEADRMRSLRLTPENFENQRQTVIEERKQNYENQPYGLADLRFDELAYQNWAYAHPIIGSIEDLRNATLEQAVCFHRQYYQPSNATLVLAGDFEEEVALQRIRTYFNWPVETIAPAVPDLSEPEQTERKAETLYDPLAVLPAGCLGYHMGELGSTDHYALSILGLVLSYGESSRLYERLVYDKNWITSLSAGPNQHKGPQLFVIWFQTQSGVLVDDVVSVIEEELDRLTQCPISLEEFEKAQNQVLYRFVSSRNTLSGIGEILAKYAVLHGRPELINDDADRYLEVTREKVQEVAQRVLKPENQTLLAVQPGESA
jgi:predicted Zn-dependent peptidase